MTDDYTVQLDRVFRGPMDLLLHLVREQEVEIHEVNLTSVISGYFAALEAMEQLDVEVAGDFLVVAATLMAIKSRSLLPREEIELEDELDPQDELVSRLLEYRRFKGAADDLDRRWRERLLIHHRGYRREVRDLEPEKTLDLGELTAFDLLATFSRLMRETMASRPHHMRAENHPLRWYVRRVGARIRSSGELDLRQLVEGMEGVPVRESMVGVFCALLELVKLGVVTAHQERGDQQIKVRSTGEAGEDLERLIGATSFLDEVPPEDGLKQESSDECRDESSPDAYGDAGPAASLDPDDESCPAAGPDPDDESCPDPGPDPDDDEALQEPGSDPSLGR